MSAALGWIISIFTVWFCFCAFVVLLCWRFTRIRPTFDVVLSERIAEPTSGPDVWAGLACALAEPGSEPDDIDALVDAINEGRDLDILLTHEATPEVDEFGQPERWIALEEEFADLDGLAAQLGERAQ